MAIETNQNGRFGQSKFIDSDFESLINRELLLAQQAMQSAPNVAGAPDFDIRGVLYDLAHKVAPNARHPEVRSIKEWLKPDPHDRALDIAAGSGFLTKQLAEWTNPEVFAIDPSAIQLSALKRHVPAAITVHGYPDEISLYEKLPQAYFDCATSLGGIHHVEDQKRMFSNVAKALRPGGRFVIGDVCGGTSVARHFDQVVAAKCLTGHTANWLELGRMPALLQHSGLVLARGELLPVTMEFESVNQMCLFFKALHAYPVPLEEIALDLSEVLGFERDHSVVLSWPLLFLELRKS